MSFIEIYFMLKKWQREGWEVHPINFDGEFQGWI